MAGRRRRTGVAATDETEGTQLPIHIRRAAAGAVLSAAMLVASGPTAGATVPTRPLVAGIDVDPTGVSYAVRLIGHAPKLVNGFFAFSANGAPSPFPAYFVSQVQGLGSIPMITWEPNLPTAATQSPLTSITNGSQDAYLAAWATAARDTHRPLFVRLMHEFNGRWYPWGEVQAGVTQIAPGGSATYPYTNTPAMYVAAFRHVVDTFHNIGATNVHFVWCAGSGGNLTNLAAYYPSDSYVSFLALDGYNKRSYPVKTFPEVFAASYPAITAVTRDKPVMIAETASIEFSHHVTGPASKAQWILDAYDQDLPLYFPRVRVIDWYDENGVGSYSFKINSSAATLAAIQHVFGEAQYSGTYP